MLSCNFFNDKISAWKDWLPTFYLTYTSYMSRTSTVQYAAAFMSHTCTAQYATAVDESDTKAPASCSSDWLVIHTQLNIQFQKRKQQYLPLDVCTKRIKKHFYREGSAGNTLPCVHKHSAPYPEIPSIRTRNTIPRLIFILESKLPLYSRHEWYCCCKWLSLWVACYHLH